MHMNKDRDFNAWFSNFKECIVDHSYYVDFKKVISNTDSIKVELNILNSLIGSKNIEADFIKLVGKYPEIINCVPILIAVRSNEVCVDNGDGQISINFNKQNFPLSYYVEFMNKIGLFDMISNHIVNNLVDYVMGVETGLDSNARKNRGGKAMENLVESYIKKTGCAYEKQMSIDNIRDRWGIDLSSVLTEKKAVKRFDFIIESKGNIYGIEVNFYSKGGSKLNETARSYKMIAEESKNVDRFTFVWITDGIGWKSAKNNLLETYNSMKHIYSINDLENNILLNIL